MKTTDNELRDKVITLPENYKDFILSRSGGKARVKSFSSDKVWDVSIKRDGEELIATCTCPSTKICHHIVALYADVKGGNITTEQPEATNNNDGLHKIADAIEMLVDGIGLVVEERLARKQ